MKVLVAGAAGGIGGATAKLLSARGHTVHGVDKVMARGCDAAWAFDLAVEHGRSADAWVADYVREEGSPDHFVWAIGEYDRVDLADVTLDRLLHLVAVNLTALLTTLRALLRNRDGAALRIVVVGSQAAVGGGHDATYAASKAGGVAAVKSLAREYGRRGVVANVVSPGPTETPMARVMGDRRDFYADAIPIGRFNTADEVAQVVTWLLLDAPGAITGTVIDVDGGLVRR